MRPQAFNTTSNEASQDDASVLRNMVSSQFQYSVRRAAKKSTGNPVTDFISKVQLAWRIFFPDQPKVCVR